MRLLFQKAWHYAGKERWQIVLFLCLHTISLGGELMQPYAFGKAVNALQTYGVTQLAPTWKWFGVYLAGFFIFQIFHHTGRYFEMTTAFRNHQRFINDMYNRLCALPMQWHTDHHSGDTVSRVNLAGQALRDFGFRQHNYLANLILSVGPVVVLTVISWQIAAISITLTCINLWIVQKMNRAIHPYLVLQNEHFHTLGARLIDFVGNMRTIQSLRLNRRTDQELRRKYSDYYEANMGEFWINQPRCFLLSFGAILTELVVILYYIWTCKSVQGSIMVGTVVLIMGYVQKMSGALFEVASSFYELLHEKAAVQSVDRILAASEKVDSHQNLEAGSDWKTAVVRGLCFAYREGQLTLDRLDLDLQASGRVAIVGVSGSGKSTLLHILAGLYEPLTVTVEIDGREYGRMDRFARSAILVPQDAEIFENTLQYNITFGFEADYGDLERVMQTAQLSDVIDRLPNGIATDIRERGVNLSGGEKQRLALARGLFFCKDKQVLLLDEVTSHLDALTERRVFAELFRNYPQCAIVCTVHRLHLLEMFDTIIVMDQGRIVEQGTFAGLVNQGGHFSAMWERYRTRSGREDAESFNCTDQWERIS